MEIHLEMPDAAVRREVELWCKRVAFTTISAINLVYCSSYLQITRCPIPEAKVKDNMKYEISLCSKCK